MYLYTYFECVRFFGARFCFVERETLLISNNIFHGSFVVCNAFSNTSRNGQGVFFQKKLIKEKLFAVEESFVRVRMHKNLFFFVFERGSANDKAPRE